MMKWDGGGDAYDHWTTHESTQTGKYFILPGQVDNGRYVRQRTACHFELQFIPSRPGHTLMFWRLKYTDVAIDVFAVAGKVEWPLAIGFIEDIELFPVHGGQISSGSAVAEWY
jgi:hypothetical protein